MINSKIHNGCEIHWVTQGPAGKWVVSECFSESWSWGKSHFCMASLPWQQSPCMGLGVPPRQVENKKTSLGESEHPQVQFVVSCCVPKSFQSWCWPLWAELGQHSPAPSGWQVGRSLWDVPCTCSSDLHLWTWDTSRLGKLLFKFRWLP